ncbi:unnamed protein product [Hermetia illucens]|uniref:Transporter n=1 Tax=Hermetia illucens TaxID=343691 RepID=A0A7R8YL99_HERIL|nr:sodium-dependent nutrient amino acid transporter 1 [Hermetia illucens]CAD7077283.1 unnamed protein product [Hermetia illucens]
MPAAMNKSNGYHNEAFEMHPESQVQDTKSIENGLSKTDEPVKDADGRDTWSSGLEFLMACISLSVGLGNIWRFPFTAYENGGGAFVIPYIIVLIIIGKPLYYLEMTIGQFASRSSVKIWKACPLLKGVGIGQLFGTVSVISYYSSLIALTLYYFGVSFQAVLPWSTCLDEWMPNCIDSSPSNNTSFQPGTLSSSELYFLRVVLREKYDISDGIGYPSWQLAICLAASWVVILLIIMRGVKSTGKASYFLALFPYVVMIALLIRAVTLDGAVDGIIYFLKPNWNELLNPKVWYSATTQLFFSLSVCMGSVVMFASYNNFSHNIYRDAMIVTTLDTFTSLLAGTTIFGILGNLAYNLNTTDISTVVRSGTGLAFISYPDAIAKFDVVPQLFSVLFFFMLFVLGTGSLVALQTTVVTVICDQFEFKFWKVATVSIVLGFCAGLVYVTPGGQWILNLVDYYGGTFVPFALAIVEIGGIMWIYGLDQFCKDVEFMTKRHVTPYWRICWAVLTPGLLIVIFVYSMVNYSPVTYSNNLYPDIAYVFGWLIIGLAFLQVPIWGGLNVWRNWTGGLIESIKKTIQPTELWGPRDSSSRAEWMKFKKDYFSERERIIEEKQHNIFMQKINMLFGRYR